MRDFILNEIKRLAKESGGTPPGQAAFTKATGINGAKWRGVHWVRWADAVAEAGFEPNTWNQKSDTESILRALAGLCRRLGRLPTRSEIRMERRLDPQFPVHSTIGNHFPTNDQMVAALRELAGIDESWSDISSLLPKAEPEAARSRARAEDGFVYLLKSGNHYKIGRSEDIERRFREVKIALPEAVTLVHTIRTDDPSGIEAYWHRRFADRRANGEWFKLTADDLRAFRRRTFQ